MVHLNPQTGSWEMLVQKASDPGELILPGSRRSTESGDTLLLPDGKSLFECVCRANQR